MVAITLPFLFFLATIYFENSWSFDVISRVRMLGMFLPGMFLYLMLCFGCLFMVLWLYRKLTLRLPSSVVKHETHVMNLREELGQDPFGDPVSRAIGRLPFNGCLNLSVEQFTLELDVPREFDGLKICQLSDLHYTGHINLEFFQRVVEEANKLQPDLIFITGDLVDEAKCLPWLESTLGRLQAKHGVYYVLGNHDLLIRDEPRLRELIAQAGVKWAGDGKWHDLEINGGHLRLSGNALPWFTHCNKLAIDDLGPNDGEAEQPFKILLSHSPDQMIWAKDYGFDLMFGGHTHGGQVRLPIIGPIIAPSRYGVKFASGNFQIGQMLMHISRGLSGDEPVRFFCPPELGCFTLRRKTG